MRGNLFIKVFVAFWLVTCAILGTWMLVSNYFDRQPLEAVQRPDRPPGPPHRTVLRLLYLLQTAERGALDAQIERAREDYGIEVYLLDSSGSDVLGRTPDAAVLDIAAELDGRRRRAFDRGPEGRLLAHEIYRSDTGPLRAVFVFERRRNPLLRALGGNPSLRIGLAVLVSGLVCFALSRLLTNRLNALRRASRRLAGGDLDTRLQVRERGGDETDELARDFNSMAEQLQARIQAQRRLLSDVSHELRSPLARLRIALALAQEDPAGRETHLARIEQEAERLDELIGQLLSSQAADIALDDHIDLAPLLRELCEDARFEGRARGVGVSFPAGSSGALVATEGDRLRSVFDNILRNALAHSAENSTVEVSLRTSGAHVEVAVKDRGPGVPDETLRHLFDEFFRVDTARSRESGGYGLGLSIARRIVQQHGGTIAADNTGSGLRVVVSLPRYTDCSVRA